MDTGSPTHHRALAKICSLSTTTSAHSWMFNQWKLQSQVQKLTPVSIHGEPQSPEKREDCVEVGTGSAVCLSPQPGICEEFSCASQCHVGGSAHSPQGSKSLHPLSRQAQEGRRALVWKWQFAVVPPLLFKGVKLGLVSVCINLLAVLLGCSGWKITAQSRGKVTVTKHKCVLLKSQPSTLRQHPTPGWQQSCCSAQGSVLVTKGKQSLKGDRELDYWQCC